MSDEEDITVESVLEESRYFESTSFFGAQSDENPSGGRKRPSRCPVTSYLIVGEAGDPGLPGQLGADGNPGMPGPFGEPGTAQGPTGPPGTPGASIRATGPAGPVGPTGSTGPDGNILVVVTGPPGPTGAPGRNGPPGATGSTGIAGVPGPAGEIGGTGLPEDFILGSNTDPFSPPLGTTGLLLTYSAFASGPGGDPTSLSGNAVTSTIYLVPPLSVTWGSYFFSLQANVAATTLSTPGQIIIFSLRALPADVQVFPERFDQLLLLQEPGQGITISFQGVLFNQTFSGSPRVQFAYEYSPPTADVQFEIRSREVAISPMYT